MRSKVASPVVARAGVDVGAATVGGGVAVGLGSIRRGGHAVSESSETSKAALNRRTGTSWDATEARAPYRGDGVGVNA